MGLFDDFFGSEDPNVTPVSKISPTQQALEKETSNFLIKWLQQGLPGFTGRLTPEIPGVLSESFGDFVGGRSQFDEGISGAIQDALSGKAAIGFDPTEATNLFREKFFTPMISMFRDIAVPAIRESLNVPGSALGSGLARGVSDATSRFAQTALVEPFYNLIEGERRAARGSLETAEARRLPAAGFASTIGSDQFNQVANAVRNLLGIQQQPLSAAYSEFLRTQPSSAIPGAINAFASPTFDAFVNIPNNANAEALKFGAGMFSLFNRPDDGNIPLQNPTTGFQGSINQSQIDQFLRLN